MDAWLTYSRKQWIRAVNFSAVLGYIATFGLPATLSGNAGGAVVAAVFGVPFALLCCWILAAPLLKRVMQKEIGWLAAAGWGALTASLMAFVSIAIGRYLGWQQSIDPNSSSGTYSGGEALSLDGILTPAGWQALAENTVLFIATGALIAVLVKWLIGAPAGGARDHDA